MNALLIVLSLTTAGALAIGIVRTNHRLDRIERAVQHDRQILHRRVDQLVELDDESVIALARTLSVLRPE